MQWIANRWMTFSGASFVVSGANEKRAPDPRNEKPGSAGTKNLPPINRESWKKLDEKDQGK